MAGGAPSEIDQTTRAVRRHRRARLVPWALLVVMALSSFCSHHVTPRSGRPIDGKTFPVERVSDGDTLVIRMPDGTTERVRLKGIDAPELARDGQPDQHFAKESQAYLQKRLAGRSVTLQFDGTETRDRFGRLLAFVYLSDEECLNLTLVQFGYAYVDRRFDSFMHSQMGRLEGEARKKERGLWKGLRDEQMPDWRREWLKKRESSR